MMNRNRRPMILITRRHYHALLLWTLILATRIAFYDAMPTPLRVALVVAGLAAGAWLVITTWTDNTTTLKPVPDPTKDDA